MENLDKDLYELLYHYKDDFDDEEGYDLYQVQLVENIDPERVKKLISILNNQKKYISYQAILILVAWGIQEGFDKLDQFLSERWDKQEEFEPHRIWDKDNVYDIIAQSVYTSRLNGIDFNTIKKYFLIFLSLYGDVFFEGNLKGYLLKDDNLAKDIFSKIKEALDNALKNKLYFQASQLLPVIAKYNKEDATQYIKTFEDLLQYDKRIQFNLEETKEI